MAGSSPNKTTQEQLQKLIEKSAGKDFKQMRKVLRTIIDGKVEIRAYTPPKGKEDPGMRELVSLAADRGFFLCVEIPATNKDIIAACKELKGLILDKIVADVKDTQKHEVEFSMVEAIETVARKKQAEAEAKAMAEGKLTKIGH